MALIVSQHSSISEFKQKTWDSLALDAGPFLQYSFLQALEDSGSVNNVFCNDTGWQPMYLGVYDQSRQLVAVVPGYLKTHSYGEYVFDHAWANAYSQHGLNYYPKWIAAIPFTPVSGQRLLARKSDEQDYYQESVEAVFDYLTQRQDISSFHWLFNTPYEQRQLTKLSALARYSVQFQWRNRDFNHFDDFLACFKSRKRKDIKKERLKACQHTNINRLTGEQLTQEAQDVFYQCYQQTYLKRSGHTGYLTQDFFKQIFTLMKDNILLVLASSKSRDESKDESKCEYECECECDYEYIAASLFLYDHTGLYGRYWGALEEVNGLHFECCYYQGIEFAIEKKLPIFNPGTQGEHKLLRGFEPWVCASSHILQDKRFHEAVSDFLIREKSAIAEYFDSAKSALPFNNESENESRSLVYVEPHRFN